MTADRIGHPAPGDANLEAACQPPSAGGMPGKAAPRLAPAALVAAAMMLVGVTLLTVFLGPRQHQTADRVHDTVASERWLRFADRADGAVIVTDATTGQALGVVTGQNGFLRVSMSGLARVRQLNGIGPEPPFTLTSYTDGRMTLGDPATGRVIELEAFGPTNEAVFGWFLTAPSGAPAH